MKMLLLSSGIRVHPKESQDMVEWLMGGYFVVKDVVRENIGNLCKGDCSQASRYSLRG